MRAFLSLERCHRASSIAPVRLGCENPATITEAFYKFHSFTLEALAFVATSFVLDAGASVIRTVSSRGRG